MTPKTRTLLVILAFVAFTLGSFIWFILSWDAGSQEPVVHLQHSRERPA